MQKGEIFLCAINNILSGTCREDCRFCTQSLHHHADIERYSYKRVEQIVEEAHTARKNGALGYCLVTAGKGLDEKKTDFVARVAVAIKKEIPDLTLIACNGTADKTQLDYLRAHGIDSYNHNLETSRDFYPDICTSHSWQERYQTCLDVKRAGLALCTGGIFGMGESAGDRDDLLEAIVSLQPESTPLNFYHPNPALPIKERNLSRKEAVEIVTKAREMLGDDSLLMVAGGRELLFSGYEEEMFTAGANAIVIGNYLTTPGEAPHKDLELLAKLGYRVATDCG